MNERVAMIQSYPGLWPDHIESVVLDGVVLVGTGLGHVAERTFPAIAKLQEQGKFVVMASQCLHGRVNMNVNSTGRELQRLGVISADDMLPEVAYVKAMWVLAHAKTREEAIALFTTPIAGEIDPRTPIDAFAKPFTTEVSP
jgi:glutamyl-tRNA(Gln) amidotransferase subunit D